MTARRSTPTFGTASHRQRRFQSSGGCAAAAGSEAAPAGLPRDRARQRLGSRPPGLELRVAIRPDRHQFALEWVVLPTGATLDPNVLGEPTPPRFTALLVEAGEVEVAASGNAAPAATPVTELTAGTAALATPGDVIRSVGSESAVLLLVRVAADAGG